MGAIRVVCNFCAFSFHSLAYARCLTMKALVSASSEVSTALLWAVTTKNALSIGTNGEKTNIEEYGKNGNVENHPGHERRSAVTWTTGNDSHVLNVFYFLLFAKCPRRLRVDCSCYKYFVWCVAFELSTTCQGDATNTLKESNIFCPTSPRKRKKCLSINWTKITPRSLLSIVFHNFRIRSFSISLICWVNTANTWPMQMPFSDTPFQWNQI